MRDALRAILDESGPCAHAGLAYQIGGRPECVLPQDAAELAARDAWLGRVTNVGIHPDYVEVAHARAQALFERAASESDDGPRVCVAHGELLTPLLVGHGNASPTGVGLTLHHTWGVPVIPGSALKGLLAHYVAATYGTADAGHAESDDVRVPYRPPAKRNGRVVEAPGSAYRVLFGAPEVDGTGTSVASAGHLRFHDALPVRVAADSAFLMHDVLTPHHANYYAGASAWPNEYEDPVPVPFVCVRPRLTFHFAVEGPAAWAEQALAWLCDALAEWGVGGKTARGYGRFAFNLDADRRKVEQAREQRAQERLSEQAPDARWQWLVRRASEEQLAEWARVVFVARNKRSCSLVPSLARAPLDPDVEDAALRDALITAGYVAAWRQGRVRDDARLNRSADNLRALAAAVDPPPVAAEPPWRAKLRAVEAKDFNALKQLADEARQPGSAWPLEGLEALRKALRKTLDKQSRPAKRAFVEQFGRLVEERRDAARAPEQD